ncbi:MAG: DUF3853 family protein [Muribaculaceae bacterium]|nr:DUF3853 family protein [Muribaculaceae bacterium]
MTETLLKTRLVDMTGEQLVLLIQEATETATSNNVRESQSSSTSAKVLLRGYKELSAFLKCSVPTACRIVSRGDIRKPAIIRSAKTLLFDPELVVLQLAEVDSRWQINKSSKKQIK